MASGVAGVMPWGSEDVGRYDRYDPYGYPAARAGGISGAPGALDRPGGWWEQPPPPQLPPRGWLSTSDDAPPQRRQPYQFSHRALEPRPGLPSLIDGCGVWEQFKASAGAAPSHSRGAVRCDRCDEAHATENCPHFRGERDRHADAWNHYSGSTKSALAVRQCSAPRVLPSGAFRVHRMPGDGACLFHSIAHGLNALGFQAEDGPRVRQRVAQFIAKSPEFEITGTPLRSWVDWDSRMTVQNYASRLSGGGFWGGAIEMAACAQIFSVDVAVYEMDYFGGGAHRISDFIADSTPRGTVLVLYSGRSHYDAIQDFSAAPGWRGSSMEPRTQMFDSSCGALDEDNDWMSCAVM